MSFELEQKLSTQRIKKRISTKFLLTISNKNTMKTDKRGFRFRRTIEDQNSPKIMSNETGARGCAGARLRGGKPNYATGASR